MERMAGSRKLKLGNCRDELMLGLEFVSAMPALLQKTLKVVPAPLIEAVGANCVGRKGLWRSWRPGRWSASRPLEKGEERTAFLREAIEREIERREAAGRRKRKSASTGGDAHKGGHRALLISSRRY
jgi:hypothetical protein